MHVDRNTAGYWEKCVDDLSAYIIQWWVPIILVTFWAQYLLVCASSWIASVVKISILCLVKGNGQHQNSVVLRFTELLVINSHCGNNRLLHSSSNLLSLSDKITSSQPVSKVSSYSVTFLVLKICAAVVRRNCIERKFIYHCNENIDHKL